MTDQIKTAPGCNPEPAHSNPSATTISANTVEYAPEKHPSQAKREHEAYAPGAYPPSWDFKNLSEGEKYCIIHAQRVGKLRFTLGFGVVLVPMAHGTKTPTLVAAGYPEFTARKMEEIPYLANLEQGNIAILAGPNSGNLVTIDFDCPKASDQFFAANPHLLESAFRVYGARGFNLVFYVVGKYPVGCHVLKDSVGTQVGEFRAGGCLTIVDGVHPTGVHYRIDGKRPPFVEFGKIVWPVGWTSKCIRTAYDKLVDQHGLPFTKQKSNRIVVNEAFFVGKFAAEHLILHEPALAFYEYDVATGRWVSKTSAWVADKFSCDLKEAADKFGEAGILPLRNERLLSSLVSQLRGHVEEIDAFAQDQKNLVHTASGMLDLDGEVPTLVPFNPEYRSLHQHPWRYDEQATCPRFLDELLRPAMSESDILLLQKLFGQVVLGRNLCQKLLIIEGAGGSGKGTFSEVLDLVIGEKNVAELRTTHLPSRFEVGAFFGKALLCGRDVPGTFLNGAGASFLKKLTAKATPDARLLLGVHHHQQQASDRHRGRQERLAAPVGYHSV
jgi:D5-like protein